jgi:hypothetical protein
MPQRYVFSRCSIELADGWTAEPRADVIAGELCAYVAIVPGTNDSLLRLTPDERGLMEAAAWVDAVGRINRAKGRPVSATRCGDFTGLVMAFKSCEDWIRGWALSADALPLDVTYRCKAEDAGRDDPVLDGMLNTLRLE